MITGLPVGFEGVIRVWDRGRKRVGRPTGRSKLCQQVEGCGGLQLEVLWYGGRRRTWPCSKGMSFSPGGRVGYIL